jgi:hypothetical protein
MISFSRRISCRGDGYLMIFGRISFLKQRSCNCEILNEDLLVAGCVEPDVAFLILAIFISVHIGYVLYFPLQCSIGRCGGSS